MTSEKCLNMIIDKYMGCLEYDKMNTPEKNIQKIVEYIQLSEFRADANSYPEHLYQRFYSLLWNINSKNRDMVLQQCVHQLIYMLYLLKEAEDELVTILFGKNNEYFIYGECLFN